MPELAITEAAVAEAYQMCEQGAGATPSEEAPEGCDMGLVHAVTDRTTK